MAPSLPQRIESRETERMMPTDGLNAARGFVHGLAIGLAFWIAVIVLAMVIA